jgi:hypothetical protein
LHGACRAQSTLEIGNLQMARLIIKNISKHPTSSTDLGFSEQTVVLGKFKVDSMLLESVQRNFNDILPNLIEGATYTAEDLVGAALWADWTHEAQRQAHLCLQHLATLPGARLTDTDATQTFGVAGTDSQAIAFKVKPTFKSMEFNMSNSYSYADVNAESIAAVMEVAQPFAGGHIAAPQGLGFFLVNGTLVPKSFLEDVESQLQSVRLNCFDVTQVADLFEPEFLDTLSANELRVLGDVVLVLIDRGCVPISLIANAKEAA